MKANSSACDIACSAAVALLCPCICIPSLRCLTTANTSALPWLTLGKHFAGTWSTCDLQFKCQLLPNPSKQSKGVNVHNLLGTSGMAAAADGVDPNVQAPIAVGGLSHRAMRALTPALSYGKAFMDSQSRPWSPQDPEGNIICSVAENKLTADLLHERMREVQSNAPTSTLFYPRGFRGTAEDRAAAAHLLERTFMKGIKVDPSHIALLAGAGAVLDTLFWCICSKGSGVLLPKPIYPAFPNDMEVRSGCKPILFDLIEPGLPPSTRCTATPDGSSAAGQVGGAQQVQQQEQLQGTGLSVAEQLDAAAAQAAAEGHPVRAVLLANPNNPLGFVYKPSTVLDILRWCLAHNVHFISDEIYGNSVWGEGQPEFDSAEVLARREVAEGALPAVQAERVPQLLHVVWGLSKDWCASGLRVGGLHTRNSNLMEAIDNLCYFHTCSGPTLWTLTQILSDGAFIDKFITENKRRMREAYAGLSAALAKAGIPHVPACAAMFCWVDLRAGLLSNDWEGEDELWSTLVYKCGVLLTPGKACCADEPGFFRVCWAWVDPAALPVAVQRISALLAERAAQKAT